jgi:DUF1365 family protein
MHRRLRPRIHVLRYGIVSLLFDPEELPALDRRLRLFSRGRFSLFSIRTQDFGDGSGDLPGFAARIAAQAGLEFVPGPVRILAMPRMLGFAFNPLVTWFLHDRAGALRAILYEVNNTFGERHHYLLPVTEVAAGPIRQDCAKAFHVSPFLPMDLDYAFRVVPPGERLAVAIEVADAAGPLLSAVHTARRRKLTDPALARAFAAFPLVTLKVVAAILWEAAKLWVKRVPVHRHPARRTSGAE